MRIIGKISKILAVCSVLALGFIWAPVVRPALAAPAALAVPAGDPLEMKKLDLQVWPEYDDPRVLTIFNGTLVNSSVQDYNGVVSFNVPKDIEVQMACELINGTEHSCQPYELEDKGDYQVLTWKVTHALKPGEEYPIWLEYYYNPLNGYPDKTMDFKYDPFYKTQQLQMNVKEPLKSSDFKINPAPSSTSQDSEGFKNDSFTFQNINAGKPVNLTISYTRSEKEPSVKPQDNSGQQAAASDPLGTSAWKKPEVIIPVILFVIVLIVFIFYALHSTRNVPPTDRIRRIENKYGTGGDKGSANDRSGKTRADEKKRIRQMLLDGEISEETYRELMNDLKKQP